MEELLLDLERGSYSHKFAGKGSRGYSGHLSVVQNVSAVTAACMMIRKEIYENAGGLDEKSFKVAFNDVDFCLRVEKLGYRNLWTPIAELVHYMNQHLGVMINRLLKNTSPLFERNPKFTKQMEPQIIP